MHNQNNQPPLHMRTAYPYFPLNVSPYNGYLILTINMCIKNFPTACNMTRNNFYCLGKGYCLLGACFLWSPYQVEQLLLAGTAVEHKLFNVRKEFTYLYHTNLLILLDNLTQISETYLWLATVRYPLHTPLTQTSWEVLEESLSPFK